MNWLFVIVLVVILICAVRGWNRGFLRMLYSLISVILLIVLVSFATPHITDFLRENTSIHTVVKEKCSNAIRERLESKGEEAAEEVSRQNMPLPEQVTSYIIGAGENALAETGVYDTLGSKAADFILSGASFLIALIAAVIIVQIIGKMLDVANKIPVIKGVNRTMGIFAGIFQAFIILWLLFLFISLVSGSTFGEMCTNDIDGNPLLEFLYDHNLFLKLLLP